MPEIPVDELPIEAVVVADEEGPRAGVLGHPPCEFFHHLGGLVEPQGLLPREAADGESVWNPLVGNRLLTARKRSGWCAAPRRPRPPRRRPPAPRCWYRAQTPHQRGAQSEAAL